MPALSHDVLESRKWYLKRSFSRATICGGSAQARRRRGNSSRGNTTTTSWIKAWLSKAHSHRFVYVFWASVTHLLTCHSYAANMRCLTQLCRVSTTHLFSGHTHIFLLSNILSRDFFPLSVSSHFSKSISLNILPCRHSAQLSLEAPSPSPGFYLYLDAMISRLSGWGSQSF